MNHIIAFFRELFFDKHATNAPVIAPVADPKPVPAQQPAKKEGPKKTYVAPPQNPMRVRRGKRVNRTARGFYRGYFGPVVRV